MADKAQDLRKCGATPECSAMHDLEVAAQLSRFSISVGQLVKCQLRVAGNKAKGLVQVVGQPTRELADESKRLGLLRVVDAQAHGVCSPRRSLIRDTVRAAGAVCICRWLGLLSVVVPDAPLPKV